MGKIGAGVGLRFRVAPGGNMMTSGIEKGSKLELAFLTGHLHSPGCRPGKPIINK
jgi:hypothetical protein